MKKTAKLNTNGKICLHIPTSLHMYYSVNCLWVSDDRTWPTRQSFWEGLGSLQKFHLYFPYDYIFYQRQQLRNGQTQHQKSSPAMMTSVTYKHYGKGKDSQAVVGVGLSRITLSSCNKRWKKNQWSSDGKLFLQE